MASASSSVVLLLLVCTFVNAMAIPMASMPPTMGRIAASMTCCPGISEKKNTVCKKYQVLKKKITVLKIKYTNTHFACFAQKKNYRAFYVSWMTL